MTWSIQSDADKEIIEELTQQTDRGAALIAAAYVEDRLLQAIKVRLNTDKEVEAKLFQNSGPLGTFSSRIDIGYLLGIYDNATHKMFHTIRAIRNDFAHNTEPIHFSSQRIRDLSFNIGLRFKFDGEMRDTKHTIAITIDSDGSPRGDFISAVKYLLFLLDTEIKYVPHRKPAAPVLLSLRPEQSG